MAPAPASAAGDHRPWIRQRPDSMLDVVGNRTRPDALCPIRPGDPCTLCQLDVTGPADCPLVYLVMTDEDLRDALQETRPAGRELAR